MSIDSRVALGGLLLLLAVAGTILVTFVNATPLLVGPGALGAAGVVLIAIGLRAGKVAGEEVRVATRFHAKRFAGGIGFAALSGALSAGFFVGFEVFGVRLHMMGLGAACLLGFLAGLIVAGGAWTRTCKSCDEDLTRRRFAVRAPDDLRRALNANDRNAVAKLLSQCSATTDAGALLGKGGTLYADGEWCAKCQQLVRVRFENKGQWFLATNAQSIIDAIVAASSPSP